MTPERAAVVRYRLERARESLAEAHLLLNANHTNTCVNRLYYACFYAASAALLSHDLSAATHTGLRTLLHQHLVKPGDIPVDLGRFFDTLINKRQKSDYTDFVRYKESDVRGWFDQAAGFVSFVATLTEACLRAGGH